MKYDVIIVGSGIAGMSAAILLAMENKRILLLERHNVFGGLLQTYRRGRLTFPTGVHSLGSLSEGQVLWRYFKYMGVLDRIELVPMEQDAFQEFIFPDRSYTMPTGHEAFRERILDYFPEEQSAIDQYMRDMAECMRNSPFYQLDSSLNFVRSPLHTQPFGEYLDRITQSAELKCVLAASYPLYGIEPRECPTFTHFAVLDSYLSSAYRVDERAKPIAKAFLFRLRELGVDMRRMSEVEEIVCEGRNVYGVRLPDGEFIRSDIVLYTGHPKELVKRCPALRPAFKWRITELEDTTSFLSVCMAWEKCDCPPGRRDIFIYNTRDLNDAIKPWRPRSGAPPSILYLAALPKPERERYPVIAIAAAQFEDWTSWADVPTGNRGRAYEEQKEGLTDTVIDIVRRQWPQSAPSISWVDTNTPLTLRDYTLSPDGTGYGIKKTVSTLGRAQIGAKTSIKGLLMAGQNSQLPGIMGAVISTTTACTEIVGHHYLLDRIAAATT